jgi:hypothetical protein
MNNILNKPNRTILNISLILLTATLLFGCQKNQQTEDAPALTGQQAADAQQPAAPPADNQLASEKMTETDTKQTKPEKKGLFAGIASIFSSDKEDPNEPETTGGSAGWFASDDKDTPQDAYSESPQQKEVDPEQPQKGGWFGWLNSDKTVQKDTNSDQNQQKTDKKDEKKKSGIFGWLFAKNDPNDVENNEKTQKTQKINKNEQPPKPGKPFLLWSDETTKATVEEIKVAGELYFQKDKTTALNNIAARENISSKAQKYLVNTVYSRVNDYQDKEQILVTLINNTAFDSKAKIEILKKIDSLKSDTAKRNILMAINEKNAEN